MTDFIKQVLQGKTIYRILFNKKVQAYCGTIEGRALDLAGGGKSSYYPYLSKRLSITRTNFYAGEGIDQVVDLEKPLPFTDESFDHIFLFNAIYIIKDPRMLLAEIKRVLKKGGTLYLSSPFVANEMPEPHDYVRFTHEGLSILFKEVGLQDFSIERFGERFTSMAYIAHLFFIISPIRLVGYSVANALDKVVPKKLKKNYPMPLGYFCIIKK